MPYLRRLTLACRLPGRVAHARLVDAHNARAHLTSAPSWFCLTAFEQVADLMLYAENSQALIHMLTELTRDELELAHLKTPKGTFGTTNRNKVDLANSIVQAKGGSSRAVLSLLEVPQLTYLVDLKGVRAKGLRKNDLIDILMDKISPQCKLVDIATVAPVVNKVVKENKALKAVLAMAERENEALNVTMDRMAIASRQSNEPCRNLLRNGFCRFGDTCKFSHDARFF